MKTILVVEDHPEVREPLARLLRFEGFKALTAGNGDQALKALNSNAVDLILLDLMLPRMDGIAFLRILRNDPHRQNLPVLVLTGVIEGSSLDQARELNVAGVLCKAKFTVEELYARIYTVLPQGNTSIANMP